MHIRITTYQCKDGHVDDAIEIAEKLLPRIRLVKGLKKLIGGGRMADGRCVIVALWESQEAAAAAAPEAKEMWAEFLPIIDGELEPEEYSVFFEEVLQ